jgi:hypothetical protein
MHLIIKFELKLTKLIEAIYMLFTDGSKLRVSMHSNYQTLLKSNLHQSMLVKVNFFQI